MALGYLVYKVTQPVPTTDATKQQWWPIPTFNGAGLVNPGVNPGFIEPSSPYNMNAQPGMDQYYWGQHQYAQNIGDLANLNSPAPQVPYGNPNAVNLGRLLTPQEIAYPNQASNAAAFGPGAQGQYAQQTYNRVLGQDTYNNQVQMNTASPAVPGFGAAYNVPTNTQMASGSGLAQQYGQSLNYNWTPAQLQSTGTNQTTVGGPGANTPASQIYSVSPQDLSAQLLAAANAQAPT